MTKGEKDLIPAKCRTAIRRHCDRHEMLCFGVENYCWTRDRVCPFFVEQPRREPDCEHFTRAVKPLFLGQVIVK